MDYNKNKSLTKWIVILPIFGVLITALLLVQIFIEQQKTNFKEDLREARIEIIKRTKRNAQDKVLEVSNFIDTNQKILKEEARNEVKNIINFAIKIIDDTYKKNEKQPKEKILEEIKDRLREVRFFDNLSGYFFIYDMEGNNIMHPPFPSLEGKKLLYVKDAKGNFTIKDTIALMNKYKEGFHEWYWQKPGGYILKKKVGFIKLFEPLDIFIGTARYEEDIVSGIKKEIQKLLINTRYGEKGYIFAFDYNGKVISHIRKDFIGTNKWDLSVNGVHVARNIIKGAKLVDDGFFMSYVSIYDSIIKKDALKTFYAKNIKELSWVIGTGVYYSDIVKEIENKDKVLEKKLKKTIHDIGIMTLIILTLVIISTLFVFIKFRRVIRTYNKNLIDKNAQTLEQKEQLVYQLGHDTLTSLPNRIILSQRLGNAILQAKRDENKIAVMFIDIDNFKSINDSLGHDVGDTLLIEVAKRLKNCIRKSDVAARLSGDEFIVLLNDCKNTKNISTIVDKIQNSIQKSIILLNGEHKISVSIGVSIFPDDGENVQTLLKNADIAMYRAKEDGKNRYKFFTEKINEEIQKRIEVEKALHVAVVQEEFTLHYQPLVNALSGEIMGVEALIRWEHPTKGLIFPDEFIPIAEDSNLIIDIGNKVIYEALIQMVKWKERGYKLEKISINIASRQLESNGFVNYVKAALKNTNCKAEWIEMEIVERNAMKNPTKSIEILNRLRKMNIDIAIDDFGTGHSSLAYIKQFPITKLKIDRVFVKNILNSYKDQAIAEAIIALGHGLRIEVLAEGVETPSEKEFLISNKCHLMQGYLFSKPLPLEKIEVLLKKGLV